MAVLISRASGNFTATTTWKVVATTLRAIQAAFTASTNTTTGNVYNADAQDITITNGLVIEGIMLYCNRVNTTGTVTVTLSADSGTTATRQVTVNASDLPVDPSWVFFEFATTLTGDGGTDYAIAIQGSSAGNATFFRDATAANWSHYIGLSTNPGSIVAGDNFYIVGERTGAGAGSAFTVTMDSTAATDYGTNVAGDHTNGIDIGSGGILQYGTAAATNYILRLSGCLTVWGDGTLNIGTTGTPIPRDSTAVLEFDCTADGSFGLRVEGGVCALQGLSRTSGKNVSFARLTANEAATSTTIDVDRDTGWLNGDLVCFAPTGTTATEFETKTLNANAGASSFTLSAGLSFAHAGTAPRNGEVGLLTRNVRIRSVTSTLMSYVMLNRAGQIDADWAEFRYIGTNVTNKRGIEAATTLLGGAVLSLNHCSIYDGEAQAITQGANSAGTTISLTNLVIYNMNTAAAASINIVQDSTTSGINSSTLTLTDVMICGMGGASTRGLRLNRADGTVERVVISGNNGTSATGFEIAADIFDTHTYFTDFEIHAIRPTAGTAFGAVVWSGNSVSGFRNLKVYDCTQSVVRGGLGSEDRIFAVFEDCQFIGSTNDLVFLTQRCKTQIYFENCLFGGTVEYLGFDLQRPSDFYPSFVSSTRHDQTDGEHRLWTRNGLVRNDNSIFRTASPSERMTPSTAFGRKLVSGSKYVAVASGQTVDISVYVRESVVGDGTDYNGARARLMLRKNIAMGIANDTVIDTATVTSEGAFEQLTGTTSAAARDGVLEFYVDCDGTTGWVNVDDWSAV